ncbi:flagellar hook-associated protein FlgK [Aquibacillus salsiterrae]|uniref:Flagellar hook-associated protein 1 n=1 Tax=Aquibacillus salsiterrae TaxID=2950439 RepID=A0A9X4AE06_9BACI|nr:flagellar hook-associated protein FlgK [Aquibacillus salsiterrae]MDC3416126.1 flagellar hook-associated protein FlgK [Aquibacillus salsiterrae]
MVSTFNGLEVAKRALFTQQSALYTTSNNIANANTEGYTRQRVNFEQTGAFPPASRNRPQIPGQVGSGVQAGSIERVRDQFLDVQYRGENSKLGYFDSRADALKQMEGIMNEPSDQGLSKTLDQFWQSLQDVSVNPEDAGARSVVTQRGIAVAETFNYLSDSLQGVKTDLQNELNISATETNSLINQINNVNQQIGTIEPNGYLPNDLYDERDRLIDQLSTLVDIKVTYTKSDGQANPIAIGKASIELINANGQPTGLKLVDVKNDEPDVINEMYINFDSNNNMESMILYNPNDLAAINTDPDNPKTPEDIDPSLVKTIPGSEITNVANFSNGKMKALVEMNGYVEGTEVKGVFNDMLSDLDKLAYEFVEAFNLQHSKGADLAGNTGVDSNQASTVNDFFNQLSGESGAAGRISVNEAIINDSDLIAASSNGDSGDGLNAKNLAGVMRESLTGLGNNTSIKSYYASMVGEMGVDAQESLRMVNNATVLRQQVEENRQSVSAVSLDEEMTNLIKFQQAYNAAARSMTTVDEMLDRIINNMGLVGR